MVAAKNIRFCGLEVNTNGSAKPRPPFRSEENEDAVKIVQRLAGSGLLRREDERTDNVTRLKWTA